jgi:hypothetical protein
MTALITKEKAVAKLKISNAVFTYRANQLSIIPEKHGEYSYYEINLIKNFKSTRRVFINKYIKVPVFKTEIEIIKVTTNYYIYPSKLNYEN